MYSCTAAAAGVCVSILLQQVEYKHPQLHVALWRIHSYAVLNAAPYTSKLRQLLRHVLLQSSSC
jgi:hypothetical protein